jgi:hypothetical protein
MDSLWSLDSHPNSCRTTLNEFRRASHRAKNAARSQAVVAIGAIPRRPTLLHTDALNNALINS